MANIRTFVNEADGQTYNCGTFFSELDGYEISPLASATPLLGINDNKKGDYPQYWRQIWMGDVEGDPRPSYIFKLADEVVNVEDTFHIKITQAMLPPLTKTNYTVVNSVWTDTGLILNHKTVWVGSWARLECTYGRWWSLTFTIMFVLSENEPAQTPSYGPSNQIGSFQRGGSFTGSSSSTAARDFVWSLWEDIYLPYILNADWYFCAGGNFRSQYSGSNGYPCIGFVPIYENEVLGFGVYNSDIATYFWNNLTTDTGEDADDYRPGHEPVPHTDDLERAVVSVKTAKAALKKYDAALATVARTGSYNDLTNKPSSYSLPTMSSSTKGGAKLGTGLSISNDVLAVNETWLGQQIDANVDLSAYASFANVNAACATEAEVQSLIQEVISERSA